MGKVMDDECILTNRERMKGIQGQETEQRCRGGGMPVVLMDSRVAGFGAWKENAGRKK